MSSTILFVDDEVNLLRSFEQMFEDDAEIEVLTAPSALEALEVLATETVNIVISDDVMPGMDGVEFLSSISMLYPDIPIMMVTEMSSHEKILSKLGRDLDITTKPWDPKAFKDKVREAAVYCHYDPEQAALARFGKLTAAQLHRAVRIRGKMQDPKPLGRVLIDLGQLSEEDYALAEAARRSRLSFIDLLQEDGYLAGDNLETYKTAKRQSPDLDDRSYLLGKHFVSEEQFLRVFCVKHDIRYVEPEVGSIDPELLQKSSIRYLLRVSALPLKLVDKKLHMALADPLDVELVGELGRIFSATVVPCCAAPEKIREALEMLDRLRGGTEGGATTSLQYRAIEEVEEGEDSGQEAVQILDYLFMRAIQLGASDLHIEPMQTKVRIRVRVDGALQQLTELPIDAAPRIASRVKILASCDIAEKRMHQDGKIFVKVEGREIDIRVSTYVTIYGETLVMRLLDRSGNLVSVDKLGFWPKTLSVIEDVVLQTSSGLVLITGPTGSGKTTTLYSMIAHSLDPTEKIITCEDPVEYVIDGLVQCSVNNKTGPTFADSLRAIVRQDPDTILVGEIRDPISAGLAFESALTGHKVLSTFHTEDAVSVVIRLLEMGVEPFLVSSALSTVIAQRLIRRLCQKCRKVAKPTKAQLKFLGLDAKEVKTFKLFDPGGCNECNGSGYKGRMGIHEVLIPDGDFREAVLRKASSQELLQLARNQPEFLTLQEDALLKAISGQTCLDEIVNNCPRDLGCRPYATLKKISGLGRI